MPGMYIVKSAKLKGISGYNQTPIWFFFFIFLISSVKSFDVLQFPTVVYFYQITHHFIKVNLR